jgi:hypothetical protein
LDEIARPGTFRALPDVDDMGKVKRRRDVRGMQFLDGFTIELLFFRVKARKISDFLLKHRDLNSHAD